MTRILILGHSVLHPRQEALSVELARQGNEVLAIGPKLWHDEAYEPKTEGTYRSCPLQVRGGGIFNFSFEGWETEAKHFGADLVYLQQEGFSQYAYEVAAWCRESGTPLVLFSWENRAEVGFEARGMEKQVLSSCQGVVAGNNLAAKRMEDILGKPLRHIVAPQTGIDTARFRPMPDIPQEYDLIYHGRLVREKGLAFIEEAAKFLGLSLLVVGGRGNYVPKHYTKLVPWSTYDELPALINSARVSAVASWSYSNYSEQWPSSIGDGLACERAVVTSNNGSIPDHYFSSPAIMVQEADQEEITQGIAEAMRAPPAGGRAWVEKNMSVQAIATKVGDFFKEVLDV